MKRVIAILLVLVLALGMTACSGGKNSDNTLKPLRPVGTYKAGTDGFYDIQNEFYEYFLHLIGFGHISFTDESGDFSDTELIQFAVLQLSYEGKDIDAGLTQREIDRTTKRHLGQKAAKLDGYYLEYDKDDDLYFPKNVSYEIGQLMSLETLTVQEDGLCVAEFRRSKWPNGYGEGRTDEEIKQDFLNGWYDGLDDVQRIKMTFRERDTAAYGYYVEILTIEQLPVM
ncbi:MAG: hypothetical protein IKB04_05220 [Clostridia bacterium]|nr:hypothetical protein [Clostridia bacterium]